MVAAVAGFAMPVSAETLSFYGTPGLMDMPSAYVLGDGELAMTLAGFGPNLRGTLAFQITPRLTGAFRYSWIDNFNRDGGDRYDRSFDLAYQITRETETVPAISIGLRDFGGTGIYSSEYIVASKAITPTVTVTGGMGWGRLAGRNAVSSPFAFIDDRFETRPFAGEGGIDTTGQVDFGLWFRGDVSPFGGLTWQVSDKLTLMAEYAPDLYQREVERGAAAPLTPLNFGAQYQFDNGVTLGAYSLYGNDLGLSVNYVLNPARARVPGGIGVAPLALRPRDTVVGDSNPTRRLSSGLAGEGMTLENFVVAGSTAEIRVLSTTFPATAQAIGRAARVMANTLPSEITRFEITLLNYGMPVSTVAINRADLKELEFAPDGSWQSLARAQISDATSTDRAGELPDVYPAGNLDFGTYLTPSLFDPDSPLRLEAGVKLTGYFSPAPGMILAGEVRQPVYSTIDTAIRTSNSEIQRVRSDAVRYYQESELELAYLTAEHFARPAPDIFSRVTVGYLERMYGGVSAEVLWYPVDSRLALGAEVNYARQRDFDGGFGFQDYDVLTGHGSAYFDMGNGYFAQVDAGRYLAGDWGATFRLDREFNNGVRVGAFFTLTDIPFEDFGEGSFDKGIIIEMPVTWFTGKPTQDRIGSVVRPVLRDGGARLEVRNRLYGVTRDLRGAEISDSWGLFWR